MVREFKVGDKCKVVRNDGGHFFKKGIEVTIKTVYDSVTYDCVDSDGLVQILKRADIELIKEKMNLKVGDKVRIISTRFHSFKLGEIVEMVRKHPTHDYLNIFKNKHGETQMLDENDIELIEYKFKVGDKVRLKEKKTTDDYYSITNSMLDCEYDILTIIEISENKWYGLKIEMDESRYYYHPSWLELAEEEEIITNPLYEGAKEIKSMFDTFVKSGFTEDKAMELTLVFVSKSVK